MSQWVLMGLCCAAGVWLWPAWMPAKEPVLSGCLACAGLLLLVGPHRIVLGFSCFLMGTLRCAVIPIQDWPDEGAIVGELRWTEGRLGLVESADGRLLLSFKGGSPPAGSVVAAAFVSRPPRPVLPGDRSSLQVAKRFATTHRVAISYEHFGAARVPQPECLTWLIHGPLLWAFASGQRQALSADERQLFRSTGTSHLLAISGLHIGIVAGLSWWLVRILCAPLIFCGAGVGAEMLSAIAAIATAFAYGASVGWPPSAQRAVAMVSIAATLRLCGRDIELLELLGMVLLLLLLREPALIDSLGFQLSFLAVLGIARFSLPLVRRIPAAFSPITKWVLISLCTTLGATLGTLPIQVWVFQELSPSAPIANLIAMPIVAFIAVPSALLGRVLPGLGGLMAYSIGDAALEVVIVALQLLESESIVWALAPPRALLLAFVIQSRSRVCCSLLPLCIQWPSIPDALELHFLPVGQGDATLFVWPNGEHWLFDTGPWGSGIVGYLRRNGIHRIEHLVLSHPHRDHSGSMSAILSEIEIGTVWLSRKPRKEELRFLGLWSDIKSAQVSVAFPGDVPPAGAEILHPIEGWQATAHELNNESMVWKITTGQRTILMTGDIELEAERELLGRLSPVNVLKVAHHGSRSSSSSEFIEALSPQIAVISCGLSNRFNHPHPETLWTLRTSVVRRTDLEGKVVIQMNEDMSW